MMMRPPVALCAATLLTAGACGQPALTHLGGEPFSPIGPLVQIGDGWVAIDSCTAGIHALVEVQVPEAERGHVMELLRDLSLALDSAAVHHPSRIELAGPFCWPGDNPSANDDLHRDGEPDAGRRPPGAPRTACRGVYLLQAQFELTQLPAEGQKLVVIHGGKQTRVDWARR